MDHSTKKGTDAISGAGLCAWSGSGCTRAPAAPTTKRRRAVSWMLSMPPEASLSRCAWARDPLSISYHDAEWGVPQHDDRVLFEFLVLEGAQAGLSWSTILNKRAAYRRAFDRFNP